MKDMNGRKHLKEEEDAFKGTDEGEDGIKNQTIDKKEEEIEDEEDPLDAYMKNVEQEVEALTKEEVGKKRKSMENEQEKIKKDKREDDQRDDLGVEEDERDELVGMEQDILALAQKKVKKKELGQVDHSQMNYEPFRKKFYIESPEIGKMTEDEVKEYREELDGIKIRGLDCPKPIKKWTQAGMNMKILEAMKRCNYTAPTPIQAQAIPAIMNGRDIIGVAKTGSGKTLAFLLPMFRHIMDQRSLSIGDGPIALIMTPTRELAVQIYNECRKFTKLLGLRCVCAYGGSAIKDQIADLKRGTEIIICTPGRMIDLLYANNGRVTNLLRITYLVLDEADRMFDMGFEPQVMKIVNNIRPDRQTVMFSATFPRQMEALARKILNTPLEIIVGGRSVVCDDVEQLVEVREEDTKFLRLLEILGRWTEGESKILIFVDRQDAADNLLRDLMRRGYSCLSLHGGKDQSDRDSTIADFKNGVVSILIATSVAARGLDVKGLTLVINYECPNHLEDYIHRCGRTGRAGKKGIAITFITPEQDKYVGDIIKALQQSKQKVPEKLLNLWEGFQSKVKAGTAQHHGSGFGGKGLERFDKERELHMKLQKKSFGVEEEASDEEQGEIDDEGIDSGDTRVASMKSISTAPTAATPTTDLGFDQAAIGAARRAAFAAAATLNVTAGKPTDILAEINARFRNSADGIPKIVAEIEINDFPQQARWRVTNKENILQIIEFSGASVTTRGTHIPTGKQPKEGERKLFLYIEGDTANSVELAKFEIKRMLTEATLQATESGVSKGKYSVV